MKPYTLEKYNTEELKNIFIPTNKQWESTETDASELFLLESGPSLVLYKKIIDLIDNAVFVVCLQSFLIQDTKIIDALQNASKRGVKVYVTDSAEARLSSNPFEEEESFMTKEYKVLLEKKVKNTMVHRQANNFHAKFIVSDPHTNAQGYIFTGNFNMKPFEENPEIGVKLNSEQVGILFKIFTYHFWEHATHEQTATKDFDKVTPLSKFNIFDTMDILLTSPNDKFSNLKKTLIGAVDKAKSSISFSTFGFDLNHDLSQAILKKLKAGVKVSIFCRGRQKSIEGHIDVLCAHGAKVYCHRLIHAKPLVVDNTLAYVFTANFENHGMDQGYEVGIVLNENQTNELITIHKRWETTFPYEFKITTLISKLPDGRYYSFNKEGRLEPTTFKKNKESKELVKTVAELKRVYQQPAKAIKELRMITIQPLDNEMKYFEGETVSEGVQLIDILSKKKKRKGVLIDDKLINIEQLMEAISPINDSFKLYLKS